MEITYKKGNRVTIKDGSSTKMATVVADGLDSQKRVRVRVDGFPMDMSITTNQSSNVYVIEKMGKGSTVKGGGIELEDKVKIVANLEDHEGYKGQVVEVIGYDDMGYLTVESSDGTQWYVGEEEVKLVKKGSGKHEAEIRKQSLKAKKNIEDMMKGKYAKGSTVKGNYVPKGYNGQLYDVFAIKNGKWEKLNDEVGGLTKKHAENMVNAINKGDGQNFTKGYSEGFMDKEGVRSFQKYNNGGGVEGGTADLSTKEKGTMYVWIDNFLEKYSGDDNRSQSLDMYKEFAKKFNKSKEQTHDIIDSGWARSRGYYEKAQAIKKSANTYGNGGGVAVSSESGLAVGTNAELLMNEQYLQYAKGGGVETYSIKVWETEDDRDMGESFIAETVSDKGEAKEKAKKMYSKNNFAAVEVENENGDTLLHLSSDGIEEYADGGNMSSGYNYSIGGL